MSLQVIGVCRDKLAGILVAHGIGSGALRNLVEIGEPVSAGEIGQVTLGLFKLVHCGDPVCGTMIVPVIDDCAVNVISPGIDGGVRIRADGDVVITGLQHISTGTVGVIGSHILRFDGEGDLLVGAGLQGSGFRKSELVIMR